MNLFLVQAMVPFSPVNDYLFLSERFYKELFWTLEEAEQKAEELAEKGLLDRARYYNRVEIEIINVAENKVIRKIKGTGGL